ncbi:capsule biosynthesis protein [Vibrio aestuarianus]|uniref:capsular polysaccharide export protein, LipB/KpsS family n=1 Tax=Vibrio aestuarianus TaxID=28171 RepID=UPI00237CD6CF|nr:capsule biosynthesis protein [Vibrio aestuarianus]MDE1231498.1 capsular biosynthesis protein [Vibrio aestuarianus]
MTVKILFSDNLHFHERNFKSLFKLIAKEKYDVEFNEEHRDWMSLYGDYSSKFNSLQSYNKLLLSLSKEELFEYDSRGVNVYDVAKAELLSFLIPTKELYKSDLSDDVCEVYNYIYDNFKNDLCLNMAAALFWLDFWYNRIVINKKKYSHIFTFSGSNIYAKSLIRTCQSTMSKIFVMETSLTGNDFYIEEKISHIANNSDVKLLAVQNKHLLSLSDDVCPQNTKVKAINKMVMTDNKNVAQPISDSNELCFGNGKQTVVILGQVVNDYSVIETEFGFLSTVKLYKKLISSILENTSYNIVFKSHPWEEKKSNCDFDITYSEISDYVEELGHNSERVKVVKDFDINLLLSKSQHAILLNSQSGLEAAFHGIKPIVIGKPFYGNYGFTNDCQSVDDVVAVLNNTNGSLSLSEYDKFEEFITIYLEKHLYSVNPSGESKIKREVFSKFPIIPLVSKKAPQKAEVVPIDKNAIDSNESVVVEVKPVSSATQLKNGVVYLFTDFEKFKKKLKHKF